MVKLKTVASEAVEGCEKVVKLEVKLTSQARKVNKEVASKSEIYAC